MINYAETVKNARLAAVMAALDAGTGPGQLRIRTAANGVLVTIPLDEGVTPAAGELDLLAAPATAEATGTGTAANAILTDSDGNVVASGLTVGTSGTDIIVDSTNITTGQDVTVNSAVITHAA